MAEPVPTEYVSTEFEVEIANLFGRVIGPGRRIEAETNFFAAGGASIGALRVIGAIESELGVAITPRAFFAQPTPRELAAIVRHGR